MGAGLMRMAWLILAGCGQVDLTPIEEETPPGSFALGEVAVVTSDFDRVEEVLEKLGIPFTLYDGFIQGPSSEATLQDQYVTSLQPVEVLLESAERLNRYDVLFVNCGARGTGTIDPVTQEVHDALLDDEEVIENLYRFVQNGGHLVVSDWSYTLLEAVFPREIDFQGDDSIPGAANLGGSTVLEAWIIDPVLQERVQSSLVTIPFPLSGWALPILGEGIWIEADAPVPNLENGSVGVAPSTPLLLHFALGQGSITFTAFHNLPRVDQVWTDLQIHLMETLEP